MCLQSGGIRPTRNQTKIRENGRGKETIGSGGARRLDRDEHDYQPHRLRWRWRWQQRYGQTEPAASAAATTTTPAAASAATTPAAATTTPAATGGL